VATAEDLRFRTRNIKPDERRSNKARTRDGQPGGGVEKNSSRKEKMI
jgi:hypothetical protein